jgi:VWFA-related protein
MLCILPLAGRHEGLSGQERHEVTVRLVLVDVVATGPDGRFIEGLKKEDFRLLEDGREIPVDSSELVSFLADEATSPEAVSPGQPVPRPRERQFIVIFDSINTIRRMLERDKPRIVERLIGLINLGREIMVLELHEAQGLRVIQPFTRDADLIQAAVNQATGSIWVEKAADSLAIPGILLQPEPGMKPGEGAPFARYESFPREQYQLETRIRFEKTINGLLAALNTIKDLPGRKSVLFVSGGIPSISFGQFLSDKHNPLTDSIVIQSQVDAAKIQDPFKSLKKSGFRSGQEVLEDLIQFANTHNISFYAMDPDSYLRYVWGDMAYDNFPRPAYTLSELKKMGVQRLDEVEELKKVEIGALKALAVDTAGEAFLGGDRFQLFQEAVERDLGRYYELSFTPRKKTPDGAYHKIEVRTKQPDLRLRFRQGYTDYTDDQKESLLFASASYNPELFPGAAFDAAVVPFIQGPGEVALWIQLALPVKELTAQAAVEDRPLRLKSRITLSRKGESEGLVSDIGVPFVLPAPYIRSLGGAEFFGLSFGSRASRLKPGIYRTIIALLDEDSGRISAAVRELEVPDWRQADRLRIINGVLGNLLKNDENQAEPVIPFTLGRADGSLLLSAHRFQPMASAKIRRGQPLALFVQLFSPAKDDLAPRLMVLKDGVETASLPVGKVQDSWNKKAGLWNLVYRLDCGSLARGDYELKIAFDLPVHQQTAEKTIPLRIL